jgi:hypothetical protein
MGEFSERETHSFFGHVANLSIEERNDLDEYLIGQPEFKEWDEAGFVLAVKQKLLKAAISSGATDKWVDEACEKLRLNFRSYKDLEQTLRRKVKTWCRAMVEDPA